MGSVSIWHWVVVGIVIMLLFGRGKVSELMGDVAKGIKAFKKGMSEEEQQAQAAAGDAQKNLETQDTTIVKTEAEKKV
jgi:sec-independent protein translocase protein TatA